MKGLLPLVSLLSATLVTAAPSPSARRAAQQPVKRDYDTGYANELVDGTACRAVTVLYARGTSQQGNIGVSTDVGPMFLDDLANLVGADNLAAQGVNYSATVEGFEEGGDPAGSELMAELTALVGCCVPDVEGGGCGGGGGACGGVFFFFFFFFPPFFFFFFLPLANSFS